MAARSVNTIVVGLGAMGSATAYQLAKRGASVVGFDRYAPPHTHGSTHGETRVTRQAIGEGEEYSPFALRSHEIWREIEQATGSDLLTLTGGLIISSARAGGRCMFPSSWPRRSPRRAGTASRMRCWTPRRSAGAIPHSGWRTTRPDTSSRARGSCGRSAASRRSSCSPGGTARPAAGGADLEVRPDGSGVVVRTEADSFRADQVVLTAGPWLPELLAPEYARHFSVTRQVLYWFAPRDSIEPFLPDRFPIFIWEPAGLPEPIYGFPAIDGAAGGSRSRRAPTASGWRRTRSARAVSDEEIAAMYRPGRACFPGIGPRCSSRRPASTPSRRMRGS